MELDATRHHVWADPVRIQQVLWNLINNAVKFTNQKGRITIRSSNEGKRLVLEIADTGIGIEPEQQSRIFKAFERANHPSPGNLADWVSA
jgi:two-component system CheB/CheR fusion protein